MNLKQKEFDVLVFIMRGQGMHNGHFGVIDAGLVLAKHVVVLLGSNNASRNMRNPFYTEERQKMLRTVYGSDDSVVSLPLDDFTYNDPQWLEQVHQRVGQACLHYLNKDPQSAKIGLIGFSKDHTSYYLKKFPKWKGVDVMPTLNLKGDVLGSTELRKVMFDPYGLYGTQDIKQYMPAGVFEYLMHLKESELMCEFRNRSVWDIVSGEYRFVDEYQRGPWGTKPGEKPRIHQCGDAVIVQSGYVVMVRRGMEPGKGLLALPGGFLEPDETIIECILREADEETNINVSEETLRSCLKHIEYFDAVHRSIRGRTITHAGLIELRAERNLVKVKGGDDCAEEIGGKALLVAPGQLDPRGVYEDHWHILRRMMGYLRDTRMGPR